MQTIKTLRELKSMKWDELLNLCRDLQLRLLQQQKKPQDYFVKTPFKAKTSKALSFNIPKDFTEAFKLSHKKYYRVCVEEIKCQ